MEQSSFSQMVAQSDHSPAIVMLRDALQVFVQSLMEIEVSEFVRASRYERNHQRRMYRNGYRERLWESSFGTLCLRIPKLRAGAYYPAFLQSPEALEQSFIHLVARQLSGNIIVEDVQVVLCELGIWDVHISKASLLLEQLYDALYHGDEDNTEEAVSHFYLDMLLRDSRYAEHKIPVATLISMIEAEEHQQKILQPVFTGIPKIPKTNTKVQLSFYSLAA